MQILDRRKLLKSMAVSSLGMGIIPTALAGTTYSFEETDQIKRLLYNENPYGPSENAKRLILQNINRSNRYATFHQYDHIALKELIAE